MAAETGNPVGTILKRFEKLAKVGVKLPHMRVKELGDLTVNVRDLKALTAGVVLYRNIHYDADVDRLNDYLRNEWHLRNRTYTLDSLRILYDYEEAGRFKKIPMLSANVERIADALDEPTETTAARLKKLGLVLTWPN